MTIYENMLDTITDVLDKNNRFVGFKDLFDENFMINKPQTFPPYNIFTKNVVVSDDKNASTERHTFVSVACSGFKREELKPTYNEKTHYLNLQGKKVERDSDMNYSYHGIAERDFNLAWKMQPNLEFVRCSYEDGILSIEFKDKTECLENSWTELEIQ